MITQEKALFSDALIWNKTWWWCNVSIHFWLSVLHPRMTFIITVFLGFLCTWYSRQLFENCISSWKCKFNGCFKACCNYCNM